jgi:RNA polymerase sigma-70 factor (ECF subfamily)
MWSSSYFSDLEGEFGKLLSETASTGRCDTFSYGGSAACYDLLLIFFQDLEKHRERPGSRERAPRLGVVVHALAPTSTPGDRKRYNNQRFEKNDLETNMDDDLHLSRIQTAWSMVHRAHGDHTAVQAAQQTLLDRYGGAVRRYALAALRDEDAADEVWQEFVLRFVRGDFASANPERGRFRAFVKTVVYRLIVDHQRRRKRQYREGPMHSNLAEPATGDDAAAADDVIFLASWRDELLARCWQRLGNEETQSGKPHHTVLRYRVDHPELRSPELAAGLTELLGKPVNAGAARVLLHRARDAFAELLLDEVIQSLDDDSLDAAEEELIELDLLEYCRPALDRRRGKG